MVLPILMTSFFKTRLFTAIFHCVAKWRFSAIQKLKLFSLPKKYGEY